jgi:CubicO group peptidase (beta-lactamase class C family)
MPRPAPARLLPLLPLLRSLPCICWLIAPPPAPAAVSAGAAPAGAAAGAAGAAQAAPPAAPAGWTAGSLEAAGLSAAPLRRLEEAVRSGELVKVSGVLIARHGKLVYERYFGGTTAASLLDTRSATKTVTSMLIGIAIDRGLLPGVDAPVLPFFHAMEPVKHPDPRKQKITVEDLLTMSSALDCDDSVDASPGNEDRMHEADDWFRFTLDLPIAEAPSRRRPPPPVPSGQAASRSSAAGSAYGRTFRYCTAGVVLLGGVLERAAGTTVADFASRNLFAPLGIAKEEWQFSPVGQAMTGGGLGLRGRELLALGQLYAGGGVWQGRRLLSERWVRASTTPHVRVEDQPDTEYGYLWWLHPFKSGGKTFAAYAMAGNGGNKVAVFPDLDMVVVVASTNYNARGMHQQTERMLANYILAAVH